MNEYYMKYFDKCIMKTMINIKSKEDAEKLTESLDSEFGTVVGWEELETEELTLFPDKNPQQNIYGDAHVSRNAKVYGDVYVYGESIVCGRAKVQGKSEVYGDVRIESNMIICDGNIDSNDKIVYVEIDGMPKTFHVSMDNTIVVSYMEINHFRENVRRAYDETIVKAYLMMCDLAELKLSDKLK